MVPVVLLFLLLLLVDDVRLDIIPDLVLALNVAAFNILSLLEVIDQGLPCLVRGVERIRSPAGVTDRFEAVLALNRQLQLGQLARLAENVLDDESEIQTIDAGQ